MKKLVNGIIVDMTADEIAVRQSEEQAWNDGAFDRAMEDLRAKRNKDLQDSDWTQLPDNTLTSEQRNAWMQFRTELRNITDGLTTVEQVNNIDYPDKP
jgi:hypothetical protein